MINRRKLRSSMGTRTNRRARTKHVTTRGKGGVRPKLQPRVRTRLGKLVAEAISKQVVV